MMENNRQPGYYRVKRKGKWAIEYYNGGKWDCLNALCYMNDDNFSEIDPTPIDPNPPNGLKSSVKERCQHPEWGTDGGGDYCKKCGYRIYE